MADVHFLRQFGTNSTVPVPHTDKAFYALYKKVLDKPTRAPIPRQPYPPPEQTEKLLQPDLGKNKQETWNQVPCLDIVEINS